jgi:hypothetical protein
MNIEDAHKFYDSVWRQDFDAAGFAYLDIPNIDSRTLRAEMVELQDRLSGFAVARGRSRLFVRSAGRFNQQNTTKYHLDAAPPESILLLGYEPSRIISEVRIADYSCAAYDLNMPPELFMDRHNPMFSPGEELLARYSTTLTPPAEGSSRLIVINNSSHGFGVLHQANIKHPNPAERRIINSMMVTTKGEEHSKEGLHPFLMTEEISGS